MTAADIAALFAGAIKAIAEYRDARHRFEQENTEAQTHLPDEAPLFDLLASKGEDVKAHADAIIAKYAPAPSSDHTHDVHDDVHEGHQDVHQDEDN